MWRAREERLGAHGPSVQTHSAGPPLKYGWEKKHLRRINIADIRHLQRAGPVQLFPINSCNRILARYIIPHFTSASRFTVPSFILLTQTISSSLFRDSEVWTYRCFYLDGSLSLFFLNLPKQRQLPFFSTGSPNNLVGSDEVFGNSEVLS